MKTKICPNCGPLAKSKFYKRGENNSLRTYCKKCSDKYTVNNAHKYRKAAYKYNLKKKYDLTIHDFNELWTNQDGKCLICTLSLRNPFLDKIGTQAAVDHDHDTGEVRGLLCTKCNIALGGFNDDPKLLEQARIYLENSRT